MAERSEPHHGGLLQSAVDEFLEGTRAVASLMGTVGGSSLRAMPEPVPATVRRMLTSLQQLVQQVPPFTVELDVLVEELHAKRLTIKALQAELTAFDHQLDVLEKSLAPLEGWGRQWARVQQSLMEAVGDAAAATTPPAD